MGIVRAIQSTSIYVMDVWLPLEGEYIVVGTPLSRVKATAAELVPNDPKPIAFIA